MPSFKPTFAKFCSHSAALLVLPLLLSTAAAAPTDTRPLARRQPAAKPKPTPLALASTGNRPVPTPAPTTLATAPDTPQTVQVKGVVLTPDGRPCAGASVYPAGAPRQLVVTDAQGAFTLPVPAGGPVSLRVEYFGEGSSRVEVPTPGAEPLRITLGR
jgi:hypothetical protein